MSTTPPLVLRDGDVTVDRLDEDLGRPQDGAADGAGTYAFDVHWEGERVGRVELLVDDTGDAELLWVLVPQYRAVGVAERALRLVVDWALQTQGVQRLEAHVDEADRDGVRAAMRAGLRKEGVARAAMGPGGVRRDVLQLARLAQDAGPDTREGFIAQLNSALPTKRAIAQGVLRDLAGRVLLCELVYKREWDLPGGVVDPLESPADCVVREVREELGLDVKVQGLLAVNWLPPWRGWSDATVFVFDLGQVDEELLGRTTLQAREIQAVHLAGEEEWEGRVAPYNQRLLAFLSAHQGPTAYLEDGLPAL